MTKLAAYTSATLSLPLSTQIYTLSLHDALPIYIPPDELNQAPRPGMNFGFPDCRSEEHTSELQSHSDLVCRLLLEKKNWRCLITSFSAGEVVPSIPKLEAYMRATRPLHYRNQTW